MTSRGYQAPSGPLPSGDQDAGRPVLAAAALDLFSLDVRVNKRYAFAAVETETPLPSTGTKMRVAPDIPDNRASYIVVRYFC